MPAAVAFVCVCARVCACMCVCVHACARVRVHACASCQASRCATRHARRTNSAATRQCAPLYYPLLHYLFSDHAAYAPWRHPCAMLLYRVGTRGPQPIAEGTNQSQHPLPFHAHDLVLQCMCLRVQQKPLLADIPTGLPAGHRPLASRGGAGGFGLGAAGCDAWRREPGQRGAVDAAGRVVSRGSGTGRPEPEC